MENYVALPLDMITHLYNITPIDISKKELLCLLRLDNDLKSGEQKSEPA